MRFPKLVCSPTVLNFTVCPIGTQRVQTLMLENNSIASAHWCMSHQPKGLTSVSPVLSDSSSIFDFPAVFSFRFNLLVGRVSHKLSSKEGDLSGGASKDAALSSVTLTVTFSPQHPGQYESNFNFTAALGVPAVLTVRGVGTYNERIV